MSLNNKNQNEAEARHLAQARSSWFDSFTPLSPFNLQTENRITYSHLELQTIMPKQLLRELISYKANIIFIEILLTESENSSLAR